MMRTARDMLVWFSGILIALTASAAAPPRYAVSPFQPAGSSTSIAGLNELGHTVGRYSIYYPELGYARWSTFLSRGAEYADLGSLGAHFDPAAINKLDQVAGTSRDEPSGRARAYFFDGGQTVEIPSLGGPAAVATAVNDRGQVAGYSSLHAWDYRAFIFQNGITTVIGSPAGPDHSSAAFDINQRGQAVGEWVDDQLHKRAFLYAGGSMTDLGTLGGSAARAVAIGNAGHVLGLSETAAGAMHSFLWFDGAMTALSSPGGGFFSANGVNSAGDIVGAADGVAYLRSGGLMFRLDDMLDAATGWRLSDALAINDKRQVAAFGCREGSGCSALLLTPMPEAQVLPMLLAGLGLLLGVMRRHRCPGRRRAAVHAAAAALSLLAGGLWAGAAAATPLSFTVTVLSDQAGRSYQVADINNAGLMAGTFRPPGGNEHAFLQKGNELVDLGTLGGWRSSARDLNNAGQVLGSADAPVSGSPRGFIYANGAMRDLGTLGGDATYPAAMNDAGQVVGFSHTLAGQEHAFLYGGGRMTDLGTLAAHGDLSYASDINNAGQVAGYWIDQQGYQRPFLYEAGVMKDLGTLGGRWSTAAAINDAGDIVGVGETAAGAIRAFLRRGGALTDLGTLGDGGSQAIDVNNAGDVVGMVFGTAAGPFIWRNGVMARLNDYLAPGSGLAITEVGRINDLGQILATGCHSGTCHQVLLSPVPEPSRAVLLLAGLLLAGLLPLGRHIRRMGRRSMLAGGLLALGLSVPAAGAPLAPSGFPHYRVTSFSFPVDSFPTVADINNAGQIVGQYTIQGNPAFGTGYISLGRELQPLPLVPGYSTWANGVNDVGGVVGVIADSINNRRPDRAFFYQGGQMRELGTLGGPWARATAVNNAGQVIGMSANAGGEARAFLYTEGRMTDLSALAAGNVSVTPFDIDQRGAITGSWVIDGEPRAFLYRDGQWSDLGDIGGLNATGRRVNGWVTGSATRVDNRIAPFVWSPETGMREITFPNDAFQLVGRGINARGDVVGDGYSDHGPCCTFLWREGVAAKLDDLLEPGSGWNIYQALDINDHGQVAAYGCGAPGCMVVRLDPVPEPAAWALLLAGLGTLLCLHRRRRRRAGRGAAIAALAAGALFGAAPAHAAAPSAYTITPYPPGDADAYATEMNQRGHMLGVLLRSGGPWVDDGVRSAFLTTGPAYVDIGRVMPGFRPAGLNDLDQVAGTATVGVQGRTRAYVYQDGQVTNLGTLGGNDSGASAINNAGQVVGFSSVAGGADHAFLYQHGVMHDIATLGVSSAALDINERGQVVGQYTSTAGRRRAFIYDNGAMRDLGTLGGGDALATDIGNGGHVLGLSRGADGVEHNFIYHDGVMTALAEGAEPIRALGINGIGDAVGSVLDGPARGAYLWSGGRLYDLAAMVSPQWQISNAVAINDLGQIAATGCLRGSCSAVLLSPIPEPGVPMLLLGGMALIGLQLRRRRSHCRSPGPPQNGARLPARQVK